MANAKHNSYADGVNAGREQAGQHGFTGAPYREAVRTGWNGALDKLKARLVELGGPERSGWSVRLSAVIVEIEALRSAQHEQPPPTDPFVEWNNAGGHSASVREAFEAGRLADIKDRQRADVALATQAYVQEQVKKALDTAGAEMFSRYTDWGGRLEHLELLVKKSNIERRVGSLEKNVADHEGALGVVRLGDERIGVLVQRLDELEETKQSTRSAVQSYGQLQKVDAEQGQTLNELLRRVTALENWRVGNCDLKERIEKLENTRTTGADLRNLDSAVEGKLREHRAMWHELHEEDRAQKERIAALEQWSKLADEKGAALADVQNLRAEHKPILDGLAVRAVELANRIGKLESTAASGVDLSVLMNRVTALEKGHGSEEHCRALDNHNGRISKLEASPPLAQYAEHARRLAQLEQGHQGLMANLESAVGELTQNLKLTDAGLGALERKVEQMEASAQAVPARVTETEETEAYLRWVDEIWTPETNDLPEHKRLERAFREGFRAARG